MKTLVYVELDGEALEICAADSGGGAEIYNTNLADSEDQGSVTIAAEHLRVVAFALLELAGDRVKLV